MRKDSKTDKTVAPPAVVVQIDTARIRAAADKTGLTVRGIAARAGLVAHSTVANVLAGKITPTAITAKRICDAIDLPIEEIFITRKAA